MTGPTYDAKRHPDPVRRFPQCTGQTDAPTDRPRESLMTIGRYAYNESDMRPNNNNNLLLRLLNDVLNWNIYFASVCPTTWWRVGLRGDHGYRI